MKKQISASCFVVDFKTKELLIVYNKKLGKWLQPGGHVEGNESLVETAIREVKEETGIDIDIIGEKNNGKIYPIAVEEYNTKIGVMIDTQFVGIPKNKDINDRESNNAQWISLEKVRCADNIEQDIKNKFEKILRRGKEYAKIFCEKQSDRER